ncbi:serine and arginine rich splicing factor 5b isoform X1 [Alosa sapidissima]|uniref:serine and arginine rich splicing factor 5b isoform X1 n=2 Tax=Alosa sapidissima TaxID=34773 RepID=UPI001C08C633|nr:serine and arginine rich splicing factor 5b isoform X1 [Alosa sapidissima]
MAGEGHSPRTAEKMNGCRIFIGRLNPSAREKDVERFFKGYGRIRDIDLKRGFGFVEFDDPRDAEDAVYELDGKELCNERVTIEHARVRLRGGRGRGGGGASGGGGGRFPARYGRGSQDSRSRNPPPMRTENRLIVENLSSRVSWQDLKDFMRQAGEVTFADAHRPKLNEGVVEFASSSDLKNALDKLSGKEINGRKIRLIEANKKRSRSRSRSESSSRSRSRGRSPSRSRSRSRSRKSYRSRSRSRSRSASASPARPKESKRPARAESGSPPTPAVPRAPVSPARSPSRSRSRSRSHSRSLSPSSDSRH